MDLFNSNAHMAYRCRVNDMYHFTSILLDMDDLVTTNTMDVSIPTENVSTIIYMIQKN